MHYAVPDDQSRNSTGIPQPYRKYRYRYPAAIPYPLDIHEEGIYLPSKILHFRIITHAGPVPRPLTLTDNQFTK